jgi:hypothetical protein
MSEQTIAIVLYIFVGLIYDKYLMSDCGEALNHPALWDARMMHVVVNLFVKTVISLIWPFIIAYRFLCWLFIDRINRIN